MTLPTTIAVLGATGGQGGGLVRALLDDPEQTFRARALTRSAQSAKARELAAAGAEVVEADLDDVGSLRAAFEGADAAFVVTNYWAPLSAEEEAARPRPVMEREQARNAAVAAARAGLRHVVWSTLEDTREHFGDDPTVPTVDGSYKVPHFDAKAEADASFAEHGVPTTYLRTTMFYEGFAGATGPRRDDDGALALTLPLADQRLSTIAVADIGKTALAIFKRSTEFLGRTVSIAGDHLTGTQYAAALTEALREPVAYRPSTWDEFRTQGFPGAVEMGNMFQYYAQNSAAFVGARDLTVVRDLNPDLQSFDDWLALHAREIQL